MMIYFVNCEVQARVKWAIYELMPELQGPSEHSTGSGATPTAVGLEMPQQDDVFKGPAGSMPRFGRVCLIEVPVHIYVPVVSMLSF